MKFVRFLLKRLAFFSVTMWLVVTLTFVLIRCLPGSPFNTDKMIHPQILENLNTKYGLDKPFYEQYLRYIQNLVRGDLGISMIYKNRSVASIIKRAFPVSLDLGVRAIILAAFAGLFLGLISTLYSNKAADHVISAITMIAVSVPGFVAGALLQYFLCYRLSVLIQSITQVGYSVFPNTGWEGFRSTVAPTMALAAGVMGMVVKMLRTSMKDVLDQNYIVMSRAKGLNKREVVLRHALKNALLPLLSISGPLVSSIIMGSFVIENIFSIPGLGRYFVSSVQDKDYTMVLGLAVFSVFIVVLINTITDILYAVVDPRVCIESKDRLKT